MQLKPEKPSKTRLQSKIENRKSTLPLRCQTPHNRHRNRKDDTVPIGGSRSVVGGEGIGWDRCAILSISVFYLPRPNGRCAVFQPHRRL